MIRNLLNAFCGILFAITPQAGSAQFYDYEEGFFELMYTVGPSGRIHNGVFQSSPLGLSQIEDAFQRSRWSDYPSFLEFLSETQPEFFRNPVLLPYSQSQQLSSPQHPRIVLLSGGTFLGFSADENQLPLRVELIETDRNTYEFKFSEILFTADGVEFRRNPQSCKSCHGLDPKPIWNPYDLWPHALGSVAGQLEFGAERAIYQNFVSRQSRLAIGEYLNLPRDPGFKLHGPDRLSYMVQNLINLRFFTRHGNRIVQSPYYKTLLALWNRCASENFEFSFERLEPYLPQQGRRLQSDFDQVWADTLSARDAFKNYLKSQFENFYAGLPSDFFLDRLDQSAEEAAALRWVLLQMGLSLEELSPSHIGNLFGLSTPSNFSFDMQTSFFDLLRSELIRWNYTPYRNEGFLNGRAWGLTLDCSDIARLPSNPSSASAARPFTPFTSLRRESPVIGKCTHCHTLSSSDFGGDPTGLAPRIPFDRPEQLRDWLQRGNNHRRILSRIQRRDERAMPPGQPLSPEEQTALIEFLEIISPESALGLEAP